jgi:serine/threonine-protein kinase
MLDEVKKLVRSVSDLRSESVTEQRKLEGLEARGRDGRQRIGFAVDALGVDASKARDEARATRGEVAPFTKATTDARARVLEAHKEILMWEGRSAFEEPYRGLEEAYAGAAKAVAVWLEARKAEKKATERAEMRDREVADLEFQIHELRAALAKLEQNVEEEKTKREKRIAELDAQTEGLQIDLLALATRFCAPLRRRPELGPLFQELEADAAA